MPVGANSHRHSEDSDLTMTRVMRAMGNTLLWVLAILGVVSGALFAATKAGVVQPVVVVSGSMTPDIQTGDLLIATTTPVEALQPGTVATIRSAHTGNFVTHRVVSVEHQGDSYAIAMKGDANDILDDETYLIPAGAEIWIPRLTVPAGGLVANSVATPRVAVPALIAILALITMSLFQPPRPKHHAPSGRLKITRSTHLKEARHLETNVVVDKEAARGSMTAPIRSSIITTLVLASFAIPNTALAQEAPFTITFEDLVPGVPQSTSFRYELPQNAVVRELTWIEYTGALQSADLDLEVCAANGACADANDPDDTVLPAGPVSIVVTASINSETPQNSTGTASGQLTFAAADVAAEGELPFTGARLLEMTVWAAALIALGALVVAVARSRQTEEAAQ